MGTVHHPARTAILLAYHQEVARAGKRGALKRAGDRLHVSDETVRRAVIAEQEADVVGTLVYEDPPFAYPRPAPATIAPQQPAHDATDAPQPATEDDDPPVQEDATPQSPIAPTPRIGRRRWHMEPSWATWLAMAHAWVYHYAPALQIALGVVLVWLVFGR